MASAETSGELEYRSTLPSERDCEEAKLAFEVTCNSQRQLSNTISVIVDNDFQDRKPARPINQHVEVTMNSSPDGKDEIALSEERFNPSLSPKGDFTPDAHRPSLFAFAMEAKPLSQSSMETLSCQAPVKVEETTLVKPPATRRQLARIYRSVAMCLRHQGRHAEAELYQWRSVFHNLNELGEHHFETIFSMFSLATLLYRQGKYHFAKTFATRTVEGTRRIHGPVHWRTLVATHNLALIHAAMGEWNHAHSLMACVLQGNRSTVKEAHGSIRVLASTICMAWIKHHRGNHSNAAQLYQQAIHIMNRAKVAGT